MKRASFIAAGAVGAAIIIFLAIVFGLIASHHSKPNLSPTPQAAATPTPTATPVADPLSIDAIRAHPVQAGPMATTQTLTARGGCATTIVSFKSDGLTEYALMSTPSAAKPVAGYPVLILAHGYISPSTYQTTGTDYQDFINAFCQAGYVVLKPDYRGQGLSQGEAGIGDIQPDYTYDILNLTASLPNLPGVNAADVAWLGHSLGGAVILRAAVADHGLPVKAIVLASGVVGSLQDILENWPASMLPADLTPVKQSFTQQYGSPESNPTFYHDVSAINYVDAIHSPVEITHGTADEVVPILFSQHLDTALTAAGKSHVFYQYAGGDHQYTLASARNAFLSNTLGFLAQYLK